MTRIMCGLSVLPCVVLLAGCSGGADGANHVAVYPVSGKIMVAGRAVEGASVTFAPLGDQPIAYATTDSAGEFELTTYDAEDGAAPGEYAVVILKSTAGGAEQSSEQHSADPNAAYAEAHAAGGAADASSSSVVPAKFGTINDTPLKRTVAADGENRFEIDLLK